MFLIMQGPNNRGTYITNDHITLQKMMVIIKRIGYINHCHKIIINLILGTRHTKLEQTTTICFSSRTPAKNVNTCRVQKDHTIN